MSIVQKSIKLVLATSFAIYLAHQFGLLYANSAGVIALLSVLDTRRTSLLVAKERLLANLLGLFLSSFVFSILGFSQLSLTSFLVLYLPSAFYWKLDKGIAPSTVLVLHLFQEGQVMFQLLLNELALFGIGTGLALVVNLYMPSKATAIAQYRQQVEDQLRVIMRRFESFLLSGNGINEGLLVIELEQLLETALDLVYQERHNQIFHQTNYDVHYFEMRRMQATILKRMAKLINGLKESSPESIILAQLFSETAQQISEKNSGYKLLKDIDAFLTSFRKRELPQTRLAFENRALLFQLLNDMQHFIQVKLDFYQHYEGILLKNEPNSAPEL
ncbi:aromatic acid exporter family protein [Streptococcus sp. E29BA]|uniref:aromatic acid exporter family protein n=1 Tax=Streptococcus sp. E29BA TaxID=3278716 RepID=UPI00359E5DFC